MRKYGNVLLVLASLMILCGAGLSILHMSGGPVTSIAGVSVGVLGLYVYLR